MNLAETLAALSNKLTAIENSITEDKGHLDHPEDLIFLGGTEGAARALNAIVATAKNPITVTIKWDGYPALIFGRDGNQQFSIMDKHMFNKKDGTGRAVYSPEQFRKYDLARGVDRSDLHRLVAEIWPGLDKASSSADGYFWGDLLFSKPLQDQNGSYVFKANPNGITYTVVADSDLGKLMSDKTAGVAVHQHIATDAPTTDSATPLNGTIGELQNNSNVAIIPSAMPSSPTIKLDGNLVKDVQSSISKYGSAVDQLMDTSPQARNTFNQLFTTYINKRIVSGDLTNLVNGFTKYFQSRPMSDYMAFKISDHLQQNKNGLIGAFTIWVAIYKLKMSIVDQLNQAAKRDDVLQQSISEISSNLGERHTKFSAFVLIKIKK
jgi:hypothetical protein